MTELNFELSQTESITHKMKVIVPVATDIYNKPTMAEVNAVAASDMIFEAENLTKGTNFIESRWAEYQDTGNIMSIAQATDKQGYSGIISDCFAEPGVSICRELIDAPIVGGFDLPCATINLLTDKYTIVTVITSVIPMIAELAENLSTSANLTSIRQVGIPVDQLNNIPKLEKALIQQGYEAVTTEGALAMLMGCTGMLGVRENVETNLNARLQQDYPGKYPRIPVIDPAQNAVTLLQAMVRMGITQSRVTYETPPGLPPVRAML